MEFLFFIDTLMEPTLPFELLAHAVAALLVDCRFVPQKFRRCVDEFFNTIQRQKPLLRHPAVKRRDRRSNQGRGLMEADG
ncbi:hypothetical protein KIN20_012352 [Parelaphostrongylus tenuis]|uniref:Uncharacterized protein n=1 Tax=Parelaphostrongylus tenuis TaxID=148309 RepID=A0AAD5MAK5_PARTN|nr:hypothetical protein KIN20_012352 [Parelaphostrongylus tenuis]